MGFVCYFVSPSDPKESLTVLITLVAVEGTKRCCRSERAVDLATFPLSFNSYQLSKVRSRYFVVTIILKGCARGVKSVWASFRHSDMVAVPIIKESALAYFFTTGTRSDLKGLYCFRLARVGCSNFPAGRGSCGYSPCCTESAKWQMCVVHP